MKYKTLEILPPSTEHIYRIKTVNHEGVEEIHTFNNYIEAKEFVDVNNPTENRMG